MALKMVCRYQSVVSICVVCVDENRTARNGCHVLEDNLRSPLLSSRCCVGMQMYTLQHKYNLHRVMLSFLHTLERIRVLSEDV